MPKRKHRLNPSSQRLERTPTDYKIVGIGLYRNDATALTNAAAVLRRAGLSNANRSFIVQALVRRLEEEIRTLSVDEALSMFRERYSRRPLASAASRHRVGKPTSKRQAFSDRRSIRRLA